MDDADGDAVPGDGRDETETERLDRNWNEILQELRVIQTGTQILTGFLLAAAFQSRFEELDRFQLTVYLSLVVVATLTTALGLAPVSLHRRLFRQQAKEQIVRYADRVLQATLVGVALTLTGTVLLIFDLVAGPTAGFIAAGAVLVMLALLWLLVPSRARTRMSAR
ncbi:hypothetical protein CLV54_2939 [Compostimonas suwonensis]|uniref:Sodium:proton antiporter n=1 Tax=Compostimonas suwonensis TaxID=1048394 RepID=A0A2M9BCF0_9MICO|nr:hypothetical protein CLV54_2939 [Compostimonas suwonensis]